jgi:hypothetical protein
MITAAQGRVVLGEGPREIHGGSHICIHHRDFPENWVPGEDAEEAARLLLNRFEQSLDSVGDPMHRDSVEQAIDDLRDFLGELCQNRPGPG